MIAQGDGSRTRRLLAAMLMAALVGGTLLAGTGASAASGGRAHRHHHHHHAALRYVSMGDSFSSGAGLPNVDYSNGCQRSPTNYAHQVALALGAQLDDVTCGLATTDDVFSSQTTVSPHPAPMLSAVTHKTRLVTVSLGLNDLSFFYDMVYRCTSMAALLPVGDPCTLYQDATGPGALYNRIPVIQQNIQNVLNAIHQRSPKARVVLVGYPQLVPESGTCPQLPINEADYPYFRQAFVLLDRAMAAAAVTTRSNYVSVLRPSRGHDICAGAQAWVNGGRPTPTASAYHPFQVEATAIARLVKRLLHH